MLVSNAVCISLPQGLEAQKEQTIVPTYPITNVKLFAMLLLYVQILF